MAMTLTSRSTVSPTVLCDVSVLVSVKFCIKTRSILSPGAIRAAMLEDGPTGIEMARMPGIKTAARKPRSPGLTMSSAING